MASEGDRPNRPDGGVRARLLQEELDRRFATIHREIELRLAAAEAMRAYLVAELDRRFDDARRETGQQFASTISMRIALQEEMDRRFTDLSGQLDRRFTDSERAVQAALAAAEKAVVKAEAASEKRFDAVNEFREQQKDIIAEFLRRNEFLQAHQALIDKVDAALGALGDRLGSLERRLDTTAGHDSGTRENQAQARELETLAATLRQASVVSPARSNLTAAFAGLAVLVSTIVLILSVATGHL